MRAAVYTRVSTEDQADRQLPIEGQRSACLAHAAALGWEVVAEYSDPGLSGTRRERPGLLALLAAARARAFDLVLAWDASRFARDVALYGWISTELGEVRLETVQGAGASPLEADIRAVLSAEQVRLIRAATVRGLRAAEERCHRHGSGRMLGFRWDGKTRREVVPEEARAVREAYERALAGEPLAELGRSLGWRRDKLLRVLRHPAYAGAHVAGIRPGAIGSSRRRAPRSQWRVRWDAWEAIVPRETWEAVQVRLDGHRPGPGANGGNAGKLALSGLLSCADCGRGLVLVGWSARVDGSRTYRYRCPSCERRISAEGWTPQILARLLEVLSSSALPAEIARALRGAYAAGVERGHADAAVRRLTRSRNALLAVLETGELEEPRIVAQRLNRIEAELREARAAAGRVDAELPSEDQIRERIGSIAVQLRQFEESDSSGSVLDYAARPLLHAVLDRVVVDLEERDATLELALSPPGSRSSSLRYLFPVPWRPAA